ncbi:hypothetical protein V6N12_038176 [Hibiscus sabdariffa]|uniref:Uncharacterized protein n=1 Tax=Hibiscus sabdariffa TaxID=183260 RepID=A0ABR2BWS0_9ROSI
MSQGYVNASNGGSRTSQDHGNQAMSSDDAMSAREFIDSSAGMAVDDPDSVSADLRQTGSQGSQSSSIHSEGTHGLSESRQAHGNDTEVVVSSEQAVDIAQTDRHEPMVSTSIGDGDNQAVSDESDWAGSLDDRSVRCVIHGWGGDNNPGPWSAHAAFPLVDARKERRQEFPDTKDCLKHAGVDGCRCLLPVL